MNTKVLQVDRYGLIDYVDDNALGVELGVASGDFSFRMVKSGRFSQFFGVDMYADHHDTDEYVFALSRIGIMEPYKLLRMRFDEALPLFRDESLDLVYVDGYAHTGEDGGRTIFSWLPKVKVGGVLAGHDYHSDWPLVIEAVEDLCRKTGFDLLVTQPSIDPGRQDRYPSWAVVKTISVAPSPPDRLELQAQLACRRDDPLAAPFRHRAREAARLLVGPGGVSFFRRFRGR